MGNFSIFLGLFGACVFAKKDKILAILDFKDHQSHHILLKNLEFQFDLTIKQADDADLNFIKYGLNLYQHVFVLAPTTEEFGGSVTTKSFVEFTENGGNLLVVGSPEIGEAIRNLGAEFGVEYDEAGTKVISNHRAEYEHSAESNGQNTRFLLRAAESFMGQTEILVGDANYGGLLMDEAIAMKLDKSNTMAFPIMRCHKYCYCWFPEEKISEYPLAIGEDISLVIGMQLLNNARVVFMSSLSFLSSKIQTQKHIVTWNDETGKTDRVMSSNEKFLTRTLGWITQYSGRIRIASMRHKLADGTRNDFYYIKESITVKIRMEIFQGDSWEPLPIDFANPIWLEFHRMDPFIRMPFKNEGGGVLSATFMVPDQYGVFNFIVKFNKLGYTKIEHKQQITVRPLRHDMYERFIICAYPYYFSAFSMMFGVFILSFAVLYHKDPKTKAE